VAREMATMAEACLLGHVAVCTQGLETLANVLQIVHLSEQMYSLLGTTGWGRGVRRREECCSLWQPAFSVGTPSCGGSTCIGWMDTTSPMACLLQLHNPKGGQDIWWTMLGPQLLFPSAELSPFPWLCRGEKWKKE
jgi:hypothetical protein